MTLLKPDSFILERDQKLLKSELVVSSFGSKIYQDNIDFHVYSTDNVLLSSLYDITAVSNQPPSNRLLFQPTSPELKGLQLDVHSDIRRAGFTAGNFNVKYNFVRNELGKSSSPEENFFITEISDSRTEIRIRPLNITISEIGDIKIQVQKEIEEQQRKDISTYASRYNSLVDRRTLTINAANVRAFADLAFEFRQQYNTDTIISFSGELDNYSLSPECQQIVNDFYQNQYDALVLENSIESFNQSHPIAIFLNKFNTRDKREISNLVANFGDGRLFNVTNVVLDNVTFETPPFGLVLKLYQALPDDIGIKDQLWIQTQVADSYSDSIIVMPGKKSKRPGNTIKSANFDIVVENRNRVETNFNSWDDILGSNAITSQKIIDSVFSSSLTGVKLNIDYGKFENFVHYSSAEERVRNFHYKIQLIEEYESSIGSLQQVSGSTAPANIQIFTERKNNIISNFDEFERYLYYASGSNYLFTNAEIDIEPWPKYAKTTNVTGSTAFTESVALDSKYYIQYRLYSATSSLAESWLATAITSASFYDQQNINSLRNVIPANILLDERNDEFVLFMDMLGQHYDVAWSYVKNLNEIYSLEENPALGIPDDLIYQTAKSFGWNLTQGNSLAQLARYKFGTDANGFAISDVTVSQKSLSDEERSKRIWRRILNNLPYLLKTKGTARGIKALMSCYGIPSTILRIREYGGPAVVERNEKPLYIIDKWAYALNFNGSQTASIDWPKELSTNSVPNAIQFRFKPAGIAAQNLFVAPGKFGMIIEPSGSIAGKGNLKFFISGSGGFITASINDQYIYDGNWSSVLINRDVSQSPYEYTVHLKKHKYSKLTTDASASFTGSAINNAAWETLSTIRFGSASFGGNAFSGSLQEVRYWRTALNETAFNEHVNSPFTYNGNTPTASFYDLYSRFRLTAQQTHYSNLNINSEHPDQSLQFITLNGTGSVSMSVAVSQSYNGFEEIYYVENPSLGGNNIYSDKIRLENNFLERNLSPDNRAEKSAYDLHPIDSTRLGIYFSPQDQINEDIFNHAGFFEIDSFIGDPLLKTATEYPALKQFAKEYWQKYTDKNDFQEYLKILSYYDFGIFQQIRQQLPARSNPVLGVVIEPNILERSKISLEPNPVIEEPFYETSLMMYDNELDSEYLVYDSQLQSEQKFYEVSAEGQAEYDSTIYLGYSLTSSRYQWNNLVFSGSDNSFYTQSNGYWQYSPTGSSILSARPSTVYVLKSNTGSFAEIQDFNHLSTENLKYNGCKISGPAINVDSEETIDGGPVVTITKVDPNRLVTTRPNSSGSLFVV